MKKTLGIGVIGLGRLGYQHTMNVTRTMGARLVAVSDPFPAALERGVEDFGVTGYADYKEMLNDPAVEAVVVATPTQTHYDVLMDVIAAG
ncbi:MAG: Gfo/Idh/MocA family protein, partial [Butyricicoccus sp.]